MMVNGKPELTCATFVSEYAPGPVRIEPLRYFPIIRDLTIDMTDFMEKLKSVKPWIIRKDDKSVSEGEYLQSPEELDHYKQFSMCINCMLCYAACPVYGLDQTFTGPAAIALAQRLQPGFTGSGITGAPRSALGPRRSLGLYFCRRVHQGLPEERRPGRGYPTVQGDRDKGLVQILHHASGSGMKSNPAYREFHPKWHRTRVSTYWWLSQWSYTKFILREVSSVFVAYFIVITLMQVQALGDGPAGYAVFQQFYGASVRRPPECCHLSFSAPAHYHLVQPHAPRGRPSIAWEARSRLTDHRA